MQNLIYPCIGCNNNARQVADFYLTVFDEAQIASDNEYVVMLNIYGQQIMLLNMGDRFQPNPSISLMVLCSSEKEVETLYEALEPKGKALMALDTYPWSKKYGWIEDQFGVSWQLFCGDDGGAKQRIVPTLMFTRDKNGQAKDAINYYTSVFPNTRIIGIMHYAEGMPDAGKVQHAQFDLDGFTLMCMDGGTTHDFIFNEGMSLVKPCATQDEIDKYWNELSNNGGEESVCGWLKDKYGVSWQIVPAMIGKLLSDPERMQKAMPVVMRSKKLIIAELEEAAEA